MTLNLTDQEAATLMAILTKMAGNGGVSNVVTQSKTRAKRPGKAEQKRKLAVELASHLGADILNYIKL